MARRDHLATSHRNDLINRSISFLLCVVSAPRRNMAALSGSHTVRGRHCEVDSLKRRKMSGNIVLNTSRDILTLICILKLQYY